MRYLLTTACALIASCAAYASPESRNIIIQGTIECPAHSTFEQIEQFAQRHKNNDEISYEELCAQFQEGTTLIEQLLQTGDIDGMFWSISTDATLSMSSQVVNDIMQGLENGNYNRFSQHFCEELKELIDPNYFFDLYQSALFPEAYMIQYLGTVNREDHQEVVWHMVCSEGSDELIRILWDENQQIVGLTIQ